MSPFKQAIKQAINKQANNLISPTQIKKCKENEYIDAKNYITLYFQKLIKKYIKK